jgi:hypothetical protein
MTMTRRRGTMMKKNKKAAADRERKMKMIKELDDRVQDTPPGELRDDLEFTRDKLFRRLLY